MTGFERAQACLNSTVRRPSLTSISSVIIGGRSLTLRTPTGGVVVLFMEAYS